MLLPPAIYHFNFNQESGVVLSDIVGTVIALDDNDEWNASNVINSFAVLDVDIINNNEVLLSCRDVIFACVKPDDPIVDDLFAETGMVLQDSRVLTALLLQVSNTGLTIPYQTVKAASFYVPEILSEKVL